MSMPSTTSLFLWRADEGQGLAVYVECPDGGYPATDADGVQIYMNSHFGLEEEAWSNLFSNAAARIEAAGSQLTEAERVVALSQEKCGRACQALARLRDCRDVRDQEKETGS